MISPLRIEPDAVYDDGVLNVTLGLSPTAVSRARREGRLRHVREGKRVLYLGEWVISWLKAEGQVSSERGPSPR